MSEERRLAEIAYSRERSRRLYNPAISPANFDCGDDEFFEGNGRLFRLRPPFHHERTAEHIVLEGLGFEIFLLIQRKSTESLPRAVAMLALDEIQSASLMTELPRLGNDQYPSLLRRNIRWSPIVPS